MTTPETVVNQGMAEMPLYDATGHQSDVAAAAGTVITDATTGRIYAAEEVDESAFQGPVNITTAGGATGGTSPTFTGTCTATQDNSIIFASKVRTVLLHNQSAVNVPYEHDIAATATSPYLAAGQLAYIDIHTTTIHVFPPNALPINAASGLIVRGWN